LGCFLDVVLDGFGGVDIRGVVSVGGGLRSLVSNMDDQVKKQLRIAVIMIHLHQVSM